MGMRLAHTEHSVLVFALRKGTGLKRTFKSDAKIQKKAVSLTKEGRGEKCNNTKYRPPIETPSWRIAIKTQNDISTK